MVPMTLCSFITALPALRDGALTRLMCTTVSMSAAAITWAMSGLRRSTRTNSVRPREMPPSRVSEGGGTVSTPMTRLMSGSAASTLAIRAPTWRETPVTSTVWVISASQLRLLLLVAPLDARLLEQLAVLLLGHPLAALLDHRAH